jgi:uncharacterized protein YdcH (DUF465 family)
MATDSRLLKDQLLRTDVGFRQLAEQHQELDTRLHELALRAYLSEPEEREQSTLKKRKLRLKNEMQDLLRQHATGRPPDTFGSGRVVDR